MEHKLIDLLKEIIDRTLSSNQKIRFDIVGSGDNGERIVNELVSRYPKNVKWYGFASEKRLVEEYRNSSLLAFPSRFESFGLSLAEGQAYGLPGIAFDVRGPNVIMKNSIQGKLVRPFNTEAFSSEILTYYKMWEKDKAGYLNLKKRISKMVIDRFGEKRILPQVIGMLSER